MLPLTFSFSLSSFFVFSAHRGPRYRRRTDEIYDEEADFRLSAHPGQRFLKCF